MLIAYFVYCIAILLGIVYKKNKVVHFVLLGYIWILFALNTNSPDYLAYSNIFYYPENYTDQEIGFRFICYLLSSSGISYQAFRMLWGTIYVLLIANYIRRNTRNSSASNYVLALLLICPVLLEVSGIRMAVATLIVVNCTMLLYKKDILHKILYLLGVFCASLIHSSSILYVIFVLAGSRVSKKVVTLSVLLIDFFLLLLQNKNIAKIVLSFIEGIFPPGKAEKWLLSDEFMHPNIVGTLSVVVFVLFFSYVGYYGCRVFKSKIYTVGGNRNEVCKWDVLEKICILSLFIIPFLSISIEFSRLLHGILIIYYVILVEFISSVNIQYNRFLYSGLIIMATVAKIIMYMYSYPSHDVFAQLYGNMFFNNFLGVGNLWH